MPKQLDAVRILKAVKQDTKRFRPGPLKTTPELEKEMKWRRVFRGKSAQALAQRLGCSIRTIEMARYILKHGTREIGNMLIAGEMTISETYKLLKEKS